MARELLRRLEADQQGEAKRFQRIMEQAGAEDTPLDDLLGQTMRLAFPGAREEDIDRAVMVIRRSRADWETGLDREGNPRWISLPTREREEDDGIRPAGVLPPRSESAAPPETDALGRRATDRERRGLFGSLLAMLGGRRPTVPPAPTVAPLTAGGPALPAPSERQPHPLRGILRLLFMGAIFVLTYSALKSCVFTL